MLVWLLIYKMTTINVLLSLHAECSKNYNTIFNSFLICSISSIFLLFPTMLLTMSDFITLILFLFFSFVFDILVHYVVCYHVLLRDVVVIFE